MIKNLCIITARGGSKGIPRKNVKDFGGKPLIVWTIECALGSKKVDRVVVSTDDKEISNISSDCGAEIHRRSKKNSEDGVHSIHAVLECLEFYEKHESVENVCMLLPTSPFRQSSDIDDAINLIECCNCDSVIGVTSFQKPISCLRKIDVGGFIKPLFEVEKFEVQRQDIKKPIYEVNGAMYVAKADHIKSTLSFHKGRVMPLIMPEHRSVDINTMMQWDIAEMILQKGKNV